MSNTQKKLSKVRPPRVQITYDVEIGQAVKEKELPFVVGVLADLAQSGSEEGQLLRDRSFIEIDADNFDKVMEAQKPRISLRAPNRLGDEGETINIDLSFPNIESFSPGAIAKSVPQLAKLLEVREKLNDLLAKLEGNDRLNDLLADIVTNTEIQLKAKSEIECRKKRIGE